jgi:hypothetical protein
MAFPLVSVSPRLRLRLRAVCSLFTESSCFSSAVIAMEISVSSLRIELGDGRLWHCCLLTGCLWLHATQLFVTGQASQRRRSFFFPRGSVPCIQGTHALHGLSSPFSDASLSSCRCSAGFPSASRSSASSIFFDFQAPIRCHSHRSGHMYFLVHRQIQVSDQDLASHLLLLSSSLIFVFAHRHLAPGRERSAWYTGMRV